MGAASNKAIEGTAEIAIAPVGKEKGKGRIGEKADFRKRLGG